MFHFLEFNVDFLEANGLLLCQMKDAIQIDQTLYD